MCAMIIESAIEAYHQRSFIMSDSALLANNVKATLHELAKQAFMLATGLQNAAPEKSSSNQSISYLFAVSKYLYQQAAELEKKLS